MDHLTAALVRTVALLADALESRPRDDRGDVPGWVMVTVMTAGVCAALYGIAASTFPDMLTSALKQVTSK